MISENTLTEMPGIKNNIAQLMTLFQMTFNFTLFDFNEI